MKLEGDLERECIQESCSDEELHEVFDDQTVSNSVLAKYDKCGQIVSAVEISAEQAGEEFGNDYRMNLMRECLLANDEDLRPPTDEMRARLDDEEFKVYYRLLKNLPEP